MDTDKRIFSTALHIQRGDGSFELSYDNVVRVRTNLGDADRLPQFHLLQARQALAFDCTNPRCISGSPPMVAVGSFSIAIQMPAAIKTLDSGQQVLVAGAAGIEIPIIDGALAGEPLCDALTEYRTRAKIAGCIAFHVYAITGTPDDPRLAQLNSKQIALPLPRLNQMAIGAAASR